MDINSSNAIAYQQLRPLKNTNTGSLIEEHIRFWKKYGDEQEQKEKALELAKAQYKSKLRNERLKNAPKIEDPVKVGLYLQDNYIREYENNLIPKFINAKKKYAETGDPTYLVEMNKINSTIKEWGVTNDSWTKASEYFANKDSQKDYNPIFDKRKRDIFEKFNTGQFKIQNGRMWVDDNGKMVALTPGESAQLFNGFRFTGMPNFAKRGKELAERVQLNDINGNKKLTKDDFLRKYNLAKNEFLKDPVLSKTFAGILSKQIKGFGEVYPNKPLTETQLNIAFKKYAEDYMDIPTKSNWLANQAKMEAIKNSKYNRNKTQPKLILSTDQNGEILKAAHDYDVPNLTSIFHIQTGKDKGTIIPDKTGNILLESIGLDRDGNVVGLGYKKIKKLDEEGKVLEEIAQPVTIYDKVKLNRISGELYNGENNFNNLQELGDYLHNNTAKSTSKDVLLQSLK